MKVGDLVKRRAIFPEHKGRKIYGIIMKEYSVTYGHDERFYDVFWFQNISYLQKMIPKKFVKLLSEAQ